LNNDPDFKKSVEIYEILQEIQKEAKKWMKVRALFQFFPAYSDGNDLILTHSTKETRWSFKRQLKEDGLCMSDLVNPKKGNEPNDSVCVFVTTVDGPVREKSEQYKIQGEYLKSHALMSLALETAEGCAEYLHSHLRSEWGFPDQPEMTMMDRFQAKYRGRRYSFGYPACPDLEYQEQLFDLMQPNKINVELTEGYMMNPEWSVSALVFSHPDATYFGVGNSLK